MQEKRFQDFLPWEVKSSWGIFPSSLLSENLSIVFKPCGLISKVPWANALFGSLATFTSSALSSLSPMKSEFATL